MSVAKNILKILGAAAAASIVGYGIKSGLGQSFATAEDDYCDEKGKMYYSQEWIDKASEEELKKARDKVQSDYMSNNRELGMNDDELIEYKGRLYNILTRIDNEIAERRKMRGEETGYPKQREHGWYLPNDD